MEGPLAPSGWSATRPAPEPFVFRSGGLFGGGKKVLTIGAAVEYMDRHPEDGIYHLRNGTLAQWLEDQEAHDLAHLARQVLTEGYTDPRVLLEAFLLGTGLVPRPRLSLRPREMRMGYILAGQSFSHDLQIKKGRGRGALFGKVHRTVPWLTLDPTAFSGRSTRVNVTADTRTLLVSRSPQEAQIAVESSASEQPVMVPVRFRVMGMPSRLNRWVIRPLVSLLVAGLIGAGLGWLLALSGVGLPDRLTGAGWQSPPASVAWAIFVGLLWALLAGGRGLLQPLAWPIRYTLGRWLLRTVIWAITFVLIAALALWLWRQITVDFGLRSTPIPWFSVLLGVLALAIVPGILGELWNTRGANDPDAVYKQMPLLRPGIIIVSTGLICLLLVTGGRFAAPALRNFDAGPTLVTAQERAGGELTRFEALVNEGLDQLTLRIYDRRAPAPGQPTPTPPPKAQP